MYGLIWIVDLPSTVDSIDILALIFAAICHDLDHPGYNNAYQVTPLPSFPLQLTYFRASNVFELDYLEASLSSVGAMT